MITQEEIPFTLEEYKAMVKTIQQLRKEKQELINKACEWVEDNIWDYIETKGSIDFDILKEVKVSEMVKDLRKAIEQ